MTEPGAFDGDRIAEVRTRLLSIPFEEPMETATFPIHGVDTVLAEVRTRSGITGVGWAFAFGLRRMAAVRTLVDDLAEVVVGKDALLTQALGREMRRVVGFIGHKGVAALAMSVIDTACWDIAGKRAGLPVYRLLGGHTSTVEAYASQGLWLNRTRDELAHEARLLADQGFTAVKMRVGLRDEDEDVARVAAVREAIGPDATLMVDANQAWTVKKAIRVGRRLQQLGVYWLEEPVAFTDVAGMARITAALDIQVCTGESNFFASDFMELLRGASADILMPDLMRMGGVTEWLRTARACDAFGVPVTPHLFMEVCGHLAAASPNAQWQEYQPWWQPILQNPVDVRDGVIHLPDRPGFGIELDEKAVRKYEVS